MKSLGLFDKEFTDNAVKQEQYNTRTLNSNISDEKLIERLMSVSKLFANREDHFYCYNDFQFNDETYHGFTNRYYSFASKTETYGYDKAKHPLDMMIAFRFYQDLDDKDQYMKVSIDWDEVALQESKNKKTKERIPYKFELSTGERFGFNPQYLLDCCQYFKTVSFLARKDGFTKDKVFQTCAFFENKHEGKIGVLMPCRLDV